VSRHSEYSYRGLHIGQQVFTITWHKEFSDRRLKSSINFLFLMSSRSHITSQLNSVIHCRTIFIDLTSSSFRKLKRSNVRRFINRTYVDSVTECWRTLKSYQFNYHIRECNSPNFVKNCIESTIHGLLCTTKGAGKMFSMT